MKLRFAGQVPKDMVFPETNEDVFELAKDNKKCAISDGASESFDSKTWAKLLTSSFVSCSELSESWLVHAIADYSSHFELSTLSWSKQAAYARGSFATLLGIEHNVNGTIDILGVGDSIAVLVDNGVLVDSFPYKLADEFQKRPELFCTKPIHNDFFTSPDFFPLHHKIWSIDGIKAPIILCMTDALAEWSLRNLEEGNPVWQSLASIKNVSDFEAFVLRERKNGKMHVDDTTLVVLSFQASDTDELPNT